MIGNKLKLKLETKTSKYKDTLIKRFGNIQILFKPCF